MKEHEKEDFKFHSSLLEDALESIDPEMLGARPVNGAGSFGKQFRHIIDIRKCYIEAIRLGTLNFMRDDIDHSLENNKSGLLKQLSNTTEGIIKVFESLNEEPQCEKRIDCALVKKYFGEEFRTISVSQALSLLTEHEIFHEGEIALYLRSSGMKFPGSWIYWGLI